MDTNSLTSQKPGPEFFKGSQSSLREFEKDFEYKTNNPYREKLQEFSHLSLQDLEGEKFQGKWKTEVFFSESELDQAYFFFPDPWPKNRHLKKRLFQIPFLEKIHHILKPEGLFYIKTDHDGYAKWMQQVMSDNPFFEIQFTTNDLHQEKEQTLLQKYQTKFEKIFIQQNKNINGFILKNKK